MKFFFLFCLLPLMSKASIDDKLQTYIKEFQLKPLPEITETRLPLVNLGRKLFFERRLSGNNNISCADCHHPMVNTHDRLPLALGEGSSGLEISGQKRLQKSGKILARNTPALFNLSNIETMFWDGRVEFNKMTKTLMTPEKVINGKNPKRSDIAKTLQSALAAQALFPMADHAEMLGDVGSNSIANLRTRAAVWDALTHKILSLSDYQKDFSEIFPNEKINIGHLAEAIAAFERRAFHYADTPYDRYLKGDLQALSPIQKKGMDAFFGVGKCGTCHNGEHLSNFKFENILIPQFGPGKENKDDLGRFHIDQQTKNMYAFKVPPLRNVALTAPYMHNGAFKTIAQLVEHYDFPDESLKAYEFVNNLSNYFQKISSVDHSRDDLRISHVSQNLDFPRNFKEEDEKAMAEFLTSALTDYRFLNRELSDPYVTQMRVNLTESGFQKMRAIFLERKAIVQREDYYYLDLFLDGGYFLRELQQPIRLFAVKNSQGPAVLKWKETILKRATQASGATIDGVFIDEKLTLIPEETMTKIEKSYQTMFEKIYSYQPDQVPQMELDIIKNETLSLNTLLHQLNFRGMVETSDRVNKPLSELFFTPTSFNQKNSYVLNTRVKKFDVKMLLLESFLRDENSGHQKTYALEFETSKVLKSEFDQLNQELSDIFIQAGMNSDDFGGSSPSPSKRTEEFLKRIF